MTTLSDAHAVKEDNNDYFMDNQDSMMALSEAENSDESEIKHKKTGDIAP